LGKPLLILDLDETLVFATKRGLEAPHDFECFDYRVYKRPFVESFISGCAANFDLAVWTSSTADYAQCIVAEVFSDVPLEFLWARERCTRRFDFELQEQYWVKDLKKVKKAGFNLERVLMVDDTARKLERNYGNIVRVSEFTGDRSDRELVVLLEYLVGLSHENDFRKIEKRGWNQG
jgi:TFIIF-interacting CTD phosphatase-like protein